MLGSAQLGLAFCWRISPRASTRPDPRPPPFLLYRGFACSQSPPQVVRIYLRHFTHLFVLTFLQYPRDCLPCLSLFPPLPVTPSRHCNLSISYTSISLPLNHIPLMLLPLPLRDFHYFRFNFSVVYFGNFLLVRAVLFPSPLPSPTLSCCCCEF